MIQQLKDRRIFTAYLPSFVGVIFIALGAIFLPSDMGENATYWMETSYFLGQQIFLPIIFLFTVAVLVWLIEKDIWCTKILVAKATFTMLIHIGFWWFYVAAKPLTENYMSFIYLFTTNWMLILLDIPLAWYITSKAAPTAILTCMSVGVYLLCLPIFNYFTCCIQRYMLW